MNETSKPGALLLELRGCRPGGRRELLSKRLTSILKDILGPDRDIHVSATDRIFDLGVGSLLVIELKSRLEREFAIRDLPVTLFFKHASVGELADHLLGLAADDAPDREVAASSSQCRPSGSRSLDTIRRMSDEEAETQVLEKLAQLEKKFEA